VHVSDSYRTKSALCQLPSDEPGRHQYETEAGKRCLPECLGMLGAQLTADLHLLIGGHSSQSARCDRGWNTKHQTIVSSDVSGDTWLATLANVPWTRTHWPSMG